MNAPSRDEDLLGEVEAGAPFSLRTWEPDRTAIVLGRSNAVEREVREDACLADGVPILRRLGGGGAVVLAPGCLVVSVAKLVERELDASYLGRTVELLAECLAEAVGVPAVQRGTGDLCLGDRKFLGSSLFRRRRLLFYQASLLVSADLSLLDLYLAHPSREPEYRRGRSHRDFVVNLSQTRPELSCGSLAEALRPELARRLPGLV
ncbi:MAG: lipoate--protein ligase family protein [Deltaproteobacteria bacterium]|nr:lipoate--protein ligase family protein [Deltaproteobacteria bacterium]